ncbi:hypothetical protein H4R24_001780 [Coemansia sp. RSA 988]|nr:hypothetical protein H4R24_001780 [Coemansia sp. RSA 988]
MVLPGPGYYNGQHQGQPSFRRTTGKVVMDRADPNNPAAYQHPEQRQQQYYSLDHQSQMQHRGGASHPYAHGTGNSAIPAPHDPRLQYPSHPPGSGYNQMQGPPPSQQQQGGYYGSVAPPNMQPQRSYDSQRSQHHWQEQNNSQSYYQQIVNDAGHSNGSADGSDLNFGPDPSRQPPQQQHQMRPGTGHRTMADTTVHSSAHVEQRAYNANIPGAAAQTGPMIAAFQQMGMGADGSSRDGPMAPRQHMSSDAMRKREQALEDDYDRDDGLTGADIDVSLFPANASQVTNTMRSDSYGYGPGPTPGAIPPSPTRQAGKDCVSAPITTTTTTIAITAPSCQNYNPSPSPFSLTPSTTASPASTPSINMPPGSVPSPLHSPRNASALVPLDPAEHTVCEPSHKPDSTEAATMVACDRSTGARIKKCTSLYVAATGACLHVGKPPSFDSRRPPTRQPLRAPWIGVSRSNTFVHSSMSKPRHIRRRQTLDAAVQHQPSDSNPILHRTDSAKNPTSRTMAFQPLSPLLPHWHKCARSSGDTLAARSPSNKSIHTSSYPRTTSPSPVVHNKVLAVGAMHASAAHSAPPYGLATGSGTSTGASSPALGGRPYTAGNGFDSSSDRIYTNGQVATPQQYPHPDNMQAAGSYFVEPSAPPMHAPYQPQMHAVPTPGSNHPYAGSSDALPPPGMRPWTASSRSLPLAAPAPHFAERDGVSSSASSTVGVPPMGMHPSANAAPPSPAKAEAATPTPTVASLEAYRNSIKRSKDPAAQLDFAKYVLEHASGIAQNEPNAKLANKRYQMLADEGLKWVRKLAGSGITVHRSNIAAEAQFFLGTVHSRGIYGVPRDDGKAFSYYLQASKAQHAEANYRTAVCYEVGVGTRKDATRALQFYRKAAVQSNVPAMYKLGVILIKGLLGVSPTPKEGINWLKRGADNATPECPHSLHELALCHESNDISGVIPDETYARQLYIKAGKLGYVPSQVRLGQAYEYGTLGCAVNAQKSVGWYTRAAEKNDPDAELALSGWYLTGAEPFLPQNDVEAYLWARRAADRGLSKAEYAVGYYYECGIGVAHPDVKEAQRWYTKAAQKGNRRAIARLKELKQMGVSAKPQSRAARPRRGKGSIF